jgi:type IV pilus assembly protein PilC
LVTTLFKIVEYREAMAVSTTDLARRLRTSLNYFWAVLPILFILVAPLLILFIILVFPVVAKIVVSYFPSVAESALTLSEVFITYWWLFSGSALIVGGWWWIRGWWWIQGQNAPRLGRLYRKMVLVRFLRTCAFMLSNNASLVAALQASAQAVHNPIYAKFLRQLTDQVSAGEKLAEALLKQPVFPTKVAHAAAIGTQVNQLDKQFIKLAEVYTQQLHQAIEPTINSLNLIVITAIGALVGWFVIAVYSPFFDSCQGI